MPWKCLFLRLELQVALSNSFTVFCYSCELSHRGMFVCFVLTWACLNCDCKTLVLQRRGGKWFCIIIKGPSHCLGHCAHPPLGILLYTVVYPLVFPGVGMTRWWGHHPQGCSRTIGMWHWGMGGLGFGFGALRGLFKPLWCYNCTHPWLPAVSHSSAALHIEAPCR